MWLHEQTVFSPVQENRWWTCTKQLIQKPLCFNPSPLLFLLPTYSSCGNSTLAFIAILFSIQMSHRPTNMFSFDQSQCHLSTQDKSNTSPTLNHLSNCHNYSQALGKHKKTVFFSGIIPKSGLLLSQKKQFFLCFPHSDTLLENENCSVTPLRINICSLGKGAENQNGNLRWHLP